MTVRTLATFNTDLPDDRIETPDGGDFIQWPGLNVALAIADLFTAIGWAPEDLFDLQERGWELDASCGSKMIRMRISLIDDVILDIWDQWPERTWYFKRKPPGPVFVGMLVALDAAIKADGRFSNVQWFTPEGYQSLPEAGAPVPVDGAA